MKLWTLTLVGEPEDGGTSSARYRVTDKAHDDPETRGIVERSAEQRFVHDHPGHPIIAEWWNYEEVRDQ